MKFLKSTKIYIMIILFALLGCLFIAWKDGFDAAKEVFLYMLFGCAFLIVGNFLVRGKK